MRLDKKQKLLQKRRWRIRKKVHGTPLRPRLAVKFTNQHIYAQCIDDEQGATLVSISTLTKKSDQSDAILPNVAGATHLGKTLGQKALKAGISQIVFDRAGRRYHGTVKAFADAVREAGVSF